MEDLTIVSCETEPFFVTLGETAAGGILLPGLKRLAVYVECGDFNVSSLIRCAESRKERFQPFGEVIVVWGEEPEVDVVQEVESLREFAGELTYRIGEAPELVWTGKKCDGW